MKRIGRPAKFPDYIPVRKAMLIFSDMTISEQQIFLVSAIQYSPQAVSPAVRAALREALIRDPADQ